MPVFIEQALKFALFCVLSYYFVEKLEVPTNV